MIKVIICEDEEITRKRIALILDQISIKYDFDIEICLSSGDPFEVYDYASENKVDILFLDIDLKNEKMDGLDLGNKLRKVDSNVIIVFISSRMERVLQVFSCMPYDFIAKPSIQPHLEEVVVRIVNSKINAPHGNFVRIKNQTLNLDEIIYIEKQRTKSIFYTTCGVIEIYVSFLQLLDCLTDNFVQIGKSFIVNKKFVVDVNSKNRVISMKNNSQLVYSKKYLDDIDKVFDVQVVI